MPKSPQEILDELFLRHGRPVSLSVLWETNAEFRAACLAANDKAVRNTLEYLETEDDE